MRSGVIAVALGTSILLVIGMRAMAGADADTITVELKDFKFKVPEDIASLFGHNEGEGKLFFYANGLAEATVKAPTDGEYEITISASCDAAMNVRAKFKVALDKAPVGKETLLTADEAKDYKFKAKAKSGERTLTIEFTNDVHKEGEYDRNFYVHAVTLKKVK